MRAKTAFLSISWVFFCLCAATVAAPPTHTISGVVATADGTGVEGVDVIGDNGATAAVTAADGTYSIIAPNHWNGTVTASKTGWLITPPSNTYTKVSADITDQNYTGYQPKISGVVIKSDGIPLPGATVTANNAGGSNTTDANGYYEINVPYNWSGTVSGTLTGYHFTDKSYANVISDQTNQNFSGYQPTISGSTNVAGATVTISGVGVITSTPNYTVTVPYGWSGTITAELAGYDFTNSPLSYTNVTTDQTGQNFTPYQPTISGSTGIVGATVTVSGIGSVVSTPEYSVAVPYGWNGTVEVSLTDYGFTESPRSYTNITADQSGQDFTPFQPTISGSTGVAGATVTVSGVGNVVSAPSYNITVPYGWSGTMECDLTGYHFPDSPKSFTNVMSDQTGQDFTPFQPTISGVINSYGSGLEGVTVTADSGAGSDITDSNGIYEITIPYGWSGTFTPTKPEYTFAPLQINFTNVTADTTLQNFDGILPPVSISGFVHYSDGSGIDGVEMSADNGGGVTLTEPNGFYSVSVPYNWSGNIIPRKMKHSFIPSEQSFSALVNNETDVNFEGTQTINGTITVKADGSGDYQTVQAAIDAAIDGDIVSLRPGTYTGEGNYNIDFKGKAITVRGSTNNPEDCVINSFASGNHRGFNFHSGEDGNSHLEYLKIIKGSNSGGGIYLSWSSPTINRCILDDNRAPYYGAAIYMVRSDSLISNCIFTDNQTSSYGGALYCSSGSPTIVNCVFVSNASNYGRGTLYFQGGSPVIRNCTIKNNSGGLYYETGGIYLASSNCTIKNCIVWNNSVWYNEDAPQIYITGSINPNVTYSMIEGGYSGEGNKTGYPYFVSYNDYHIQSNSHCIGRGDPDTVILLGETDIDGDPRILGRIDIGADEYVPENQPVLHLPKRTLEFRAGKDSVIAQQTLNIENLGEFSFDWQIVNDCNWVAVDSLAGQTESYGMSAVGVNIDQAGMDYGSYSCQLDVVADTAAYSPQSVIVNLEVLGPELGVSTNSIYFVAGGLNDVPDSQLLTIENTGFDTLNWTISDANSCSWLEVSSTTGLTTNDAPIEASVSVDPDAAGSYGLHTCDLIISDPNASNSPQVVTVTLDVLRPEIGVSLDGNNFDVISFECDVDEPNVLMQTISISNSGYDVLNWQVAEDCQWLSVDPVSGQCVAGSNEVTLTVDTAGLEIGFYTCELTITDNNASNSPVTIPVSLHVYRNRERHVPTEYPTIQAAISAAVDGDHVIIHPGQYGEYVGLLDKQLTIRSVDPDDPASVDSTIIESGMFTNQVPILNPLVIEGLSFIYKPNYKKNRGLYFWDTAAHVRNCIFKNWTNGGVVIQNSGSILIENCLFAGNRIAGVHIQFRTWNAVVEINNCTIVDTLPGYDTHYGDTIAGIRMNGYDNNHLHIKNSILSNYVSEGDAEIAFNSQFSSEMNYASISNSCIPAGPNSIMIVDPNFVDFTYGPDNIEADPLFILRGYLDDANTPTHYYDDIWVDGDYHVKSQAGRFVWDGFARADFNLDKRVDLVDFAMLAQVWGDVLCGVVTLSSQFNLDGDCSIGLGDLMIFIDDYLQPQVFGAWVADEVTSPCIDAGDPNDMDWQNELWPHGGRVNMGAYGGTPQASMSLSDMGNPADMNHDDAVDLIDWSLWADDWADERVLLDSDFDRNNIVDPNDLDIFMNNWLWGQ